jgi:hypothetical protein
MGFEPKTCGVKDKGDNHLASMTGFVRATGLVRYLVIRKPQRAYVSQNMILRLSSDFSPSENLTESHWRHYFLPVATVGQVLDLWQSEGALGG